MSCQRLSPAAFKKGLMSPGESSYGNDSFEEEFDEGNKQTGDGDNAEHDHENTHESGGDNGDVDDDDFELSEDEGGRDASDKKKGDTNCGIGEAEEKENTQFEEGMNLDDFLKQFGQEEEGDNVGGEGGNAEGKKSVKNSVIDSEHLRPLDGMSPPLTGKDARDVYLRKVLHGSKDSTPAGAATGGGGADPTTAATAAIAAMSTNMSPGQEQQKELRQEQEHGGTADHTTDTGTVLPTRNGSGSPNLSNNNNSNSNSNSECDRSTVGSAGSGSGRPDSFKKKLKFALCQEEHNAGKIDDLMTRLRKKEAEREEAERSLFGTGMGGDGSSNGGDDDSEDTAVESDGHCHDSGKSALTTAAGKVTKTETSTTAADILSSAVTSCTENSKNGVRTTAASNSHHGVEDLGVGDLKKQKAAPYKYPVLVDSAGSVANNYKRMKARLSNALVEMNLQDGVTMDLTEGAGADSSRSSKHHNKHGVGMGMGMGAHPSIGRGGSGGGNAMDSSGSSSSNNPLAAQVAQLKADLKRRDDRLGRLQEHDSLLGNKCDALTKELAALKQQLQVAESKTQNAKTQESAQSKKKKKKALKRTEELEAENARLTEENGSLMEREGALMEAIDELSKQNEDLMGQLKEAMDKEMRFTHIINSISMTRTEHSRSAPGGNDSPTQQQYEYETMAMGGASGGLSISRSRSDCHLRSPEEKTTKQQGQGQVAANARRKKNNVSKTTGLASAIYAKGSAKPSAKLPTLYKQSVKGGGFD